MDQHGNSLTSVDLTWTLHDTNAGSLTPSGVLTAGEVAQSFPDTLEVRATQGDLVSTAGADVTITPGSLEQVVIAPGSVELGMEMTQQFVAVGADRFGNHIPGFDFIWSVEAEGGTIDADGLFTAGGEPGTYDETVRAEVAQGDVTRSATASVTIEPDRIAFISDREDDQLDIYTMNVDGTNVQRVTRDPASEFYLSWSPNDRRIVFEVFDGIVAVNDDGDWSVLLVEDSGDTIHRWPEWSPDGGKVILVRIPSFFAEDNPTNDVFVFDIDGGNATRLTDTTDGDEFVPRWSPDGTKIAYDFTPIAGEGDIYVMNVDGTDVQRLTTDPANDTEPMWSPDGT